MTHFFKSKNNQNKYYIYLLVSKPHYNENNFEIKTKIIVAKSMILHDLSYIINNYDKIIENELENKILEHISLTYNFKEQIPKYPYDIFYTNRVLLHSFLHICNNLNSMKNILFKEKVNFISNINYLKRIKDWSDNWRKNRYSIEKYQNVFSEINSESIFSMNTLSECYFNIFEDKDIKTTFNCLPMSYDEKSMFERNSERPNTDLIEKCFSYFEDEKQIKFM